MAAGFAIAGTTSGWVVGYIETGKGWLTSFSPDAVFIDAVREVAPDATAIAIEAIGDGLAVFGANGRQLVANKAFRRRRSNDQEASFSEPVLKTSWEERCADNRWIKIDEAKTPSGLCVYLETDITALKEREQDLVAAKMTAEAAGKSRSDFLSLMSHYLRTPLNAIIGFS